MIAALAALLLVAGGQSVDRELRVIQLYDWAAGAWDSGYFQEFCLTPSQIERFDAAMARLKAAEQVLVGRYGNTVVDERELSPIPAIRPRKRPCTPENDRTTLERFETLVGELETELKKQ